MSALAAVAIVDDGHSQQKRSEGAGTSQERAGTEGRTGRWEPSFGFTDGFDPTGEYLGNAFGIYSSLLLRTLVGYNHVEGAAGNELVPDLATTAPSPPTAA